jgi:hypothetical protein
MVEENEPHPTGVRIRFSPDKVTWTRVVDGAVVEERDVTADYAKNQAGQWIMTPVVSSLQEQPGAVQASLLTGRKGGLLHG